VLVDDGAYADSSPSGLVGGRVGGPYRWEAWEVRAYGVRTNRFGSGAYRGPTATQTAFALEQLLDRLAAELGVDPIELRARNAVEEGDSRLDGVRWPRIGLREALEAVREHPLWVGRHELAPEEGVGLAAGLFPGAGVTSGATCRMDPDGAITVVTGLADLTGTATGLVAIAAETLGVPVEQVRLAAVDTDAAPVTPVSGGSTITYSLGAAVRAAAEDARRQILEVAGSELEISPDDLELVDGEVRAVGSPDTKLSLARVARLTTGFGGRYPPVAGNGRTVPRELAPSAAVSLAHVRVDPDTGEVRCLRIVAAQDVGRAINPSLCEGQITGGAAQSLGWALLEELRHDDDGRLLNGSFLGYALPRAEQVPPIEPILVEVPSPYGPFGARGIGESAIVPGAAAIANAVAAATGARFHELPLTPARVWRALRDAR
jgi:CO/xanthine dehydrogenase Mo-binding subunit